MLVGDTCSNDEENILKKHGLENLRPNGSLYNAFICKKDGHMYMAFFNATQNKPLFYINDNQVNDTSQFPDIFRKIFPEYDTNSETPRYDKIEADISKMLAEWKQKTKIIKKDPDGPQPGNNNNNNNNNINNNNINNNNINNNNINNDGNNDINNDSDKKNMVFVANQNNVTTPAPNNNNVTTPTSDNSRVSLNNNRNQSKVMLTKTTTAKNNLSLKKGNEDQNNQKTQEQTQGNKDDNQNQTQSTITPVSPQSEDKNNKQSEDSKQGSQNNNKAEQKSYIPSFVLGAGSGIGVIVGIIVKNNKVVAIVSFVTAGLCGAGCVFHSLWAYNHNKEINNKNPNNNIDNAQKKGKEKA